MLVTLLRSMGANVPTEVEQRIEAVRDGWPGLSCSWVGGVCTIRHGGLLEWNGGGMRTRSSAHCCQGGGRLHCLCCSTSAHPPLPVCVCVQHNAQRAVFSDEVEQRRQAILDAQTDLAGVQVGCARTVGEMQFQIASHGRPPWVCGREGAGAVGAGAWQLALLGWYWRHCS